MRPGRSPSAVMDRLRRCQQNLDADFKFVLTCNKFHLHGEDYHDGYSIHLPV